MAEINSVEWSSYVRFRPGVDAPAYKLDRPTAVEEFERLMEIKEQRIEALVGLLDRNGVDHDDLISLGRWFTESVREDPQRSGFLETNWYSVCTDLGLMLGDRVIEDSDGELRWELRTAGRWSVSYQRAVIVGYPREKRGFHVDFILSAIQMGHKIIQAKSVSENTHELFGIWVDSSSRRL